MFKISDLKIGTRLGVGFCLVLACAVTLLVLGLWRMSQLQASTDLIVTGRVASFSGAMDMREGRFSMALALRKTSMPTDATEGEREGRKLEQTMVHYAKSEESIKNLLLSPQGKAILASLIAQEHAMAPIVAKLKEFVAGGSYFDDAGDNYRATPMGMLAVGLITIALGGFAAFVITRTITVPLHHAAHIADTIADTIAGRDLTCHMTKSSRRCGTWPTS